MLPLRPICKRVWGYFGGRNIFEADWTASSYQGETLGKFEG